ncbi:hypothetical protein JZX76_01040 [Haloarcula hispanica]|uniref:Uncharacterized protein n=1 Tax=Haloarcula hispanica TaxID=51589 RepID=A0A482TUU6_HALHI|nr:hypothetical protein [Haloarcula hispanica]MCJ0618160.1 hypothetical protein [Haloarcula hispanica]RYJ15669.1 hypothetical protein ELS20_01060 [Haloarcula hispanica]
MSDESETLHLHVSVGEITIEVDGPVDDAETWFEALREDYLGDVDPETVANAVTAESNPNPSREGNGNPSGHQAQSSGKSKSLQEFYKLANDPTKRDSALIVGWYLEYHEGQDNFTKPEVEERATDAKISLGANVSRDLSNQVKDSYLEKVDERDGQDAYHLTLTGEEYVESELLNKSE